jgi:hypothetical protein
MVVSTNISWETGTFFPEKRIADSRGKGVQCEQA